MGFLCRRKRYQVDIESKSKSINEICCRKGVCYKMRTFCCSEDFYRWICCKRKRCGNALLEERILEKRAKEIEDDRKEFDAIGPIDNEELKSGLIEKSENVLDMWDGKKQKKGQRQIDSK